MDNTQKAIEAMRKEVANLKDQVAAANEKLDQLLMLNEALAAKQSALTMQQAAERLGVSTRTIQRYILDGKLRATQASTSTAVRIPAEEIMRFLRRKET